MKPDLIGTLYTRTDVEQMAAGIRARCSIAPQVAVITGTGFARFGEELEDATSIPYSELPGFPQPGTPGHVGELVIGRLHGRAVACLRGKPALLDGHPAQLVVLPVRLLWLLGCQSLLYTNTVGAINPTMRVGDFVAIRNHINFYGTNPLIGEANDQWGERWFDMAYPYDRELTARLHQVARERGITLHEGVYFGTLGPAFETAAEIEMAGRMGADVVGMTTVMEVIAARQLGMRVACFGFVSNLAAGVEGTLVHNADVLQAARPAYERYNQLMRGMLPHMP